MGTDIISSLFLMTLGIVLVVAIVLYLRFMRKPSNRHPMEHQRERNIDEMRHDVPPKAK